MLKNRLVAAVLAAALILSSSPAEAARKAPAKTVKVALKAPAPKPADNRATIARIAAAAKPSIVMVYTLVETKAGKQVGAGTGFFYRGRLVTARHVVLDANKQVITRISVRDSAGRYHTARVVKVSDKTDIAILEADMSLPASLTSRPMAQVKLQERCFVIGNPGGAGFTVSPEGGVSGKATFEDGGYFNHTAATSPGYSGGPVFGMDGAVIGLLHYHTGAVSMDDIDELIDSL